MMIMMMIMMMIRTLEVKAQLESLRLGFTSVFPMEKLGSFTPAEVRKLS